MRARMLLEARRLEARALALESGEVDGCADPEGAAALYSIAALVYHASPNASSAEAGAGRAAELKAAQAAERERARRAGEPQKELF